MCYRHGVYFPNDYEVVGERLVEELGSGVQVWDIFIKQTPLLFELRLLGIADYQLNQSGEPETVVTITAGFPSEVYIG